MVFRLGFEVVQRESRKAKRKTEDLIVDATLQRTQKMEDR